MGTLTQILEAIFASVFESPKSELVTSIGTPRLTGSPLAVAPSSG